MSIERWRHLVAIAGLAALTACATPPAPPPLPSPPPPPPVVVVDEPEPIPYRPIPPRGAAYRMEVPPKNELGERLSINYGLDESETVWHLRSAWNVAALNCVGPENQQIVDAYGDFLTSFPNGLASANREMDRRYREEFGSDGVRAREEHSTQVYNYFTLPGARADLCAVARQIAADFASWEGDDVKEYAATHLPLFENAYVDFFNEYERYQQLSGEWDRLYGADYGASQPGYVAIYGSQQRTVGEALVGDQPEPVGQVLDPDTGVSIPVVPVPESSVRTPVVQPVPQEDQVSGPGEE